MKERGATERAWCLPHVLRKGSTVAFTAPASTATEDLELLRQLWQAAGYEVIFGDTCYRKGEYGGTPRQQAEEFMYFMTEAPCEAVIALRGGYGCVRYLEQLDYGKLRQYAKPFVGYSDCTALHCAIGRYSRLVTYHGPMGYDQLKYKVQEEPQVKAGMDMYYLLETLEGRLKTIEPLPEPPRGHISSGGGTGRLLGGNLTVLGSLGGTPFAPALEDWDDAILLIEDIGEPAYKLDRILQQLRQQGVLERIQGVALGTFTDCELMLDDGELYEIGQEILGFMDMAKEPFVCYVPTGHGTPHRTLPLGSEVSFRGISNTLVCLPYCR